MVQIREWLPHKTSANRVVPHRDWQKDKPDKKIATNENQQRSTPVPSGITALFAHESPGPAKGLFCFCSLNGDLSPLENSSLTCQINVRGLPPDIPIGRPAGNPVPYKSASSVEKADGRGPVIF